MKLISYISPHGESYGVVKGDEVFDLSIKLGIPDLRSALGSDALARANFLIDGTTADFSLKELRMLPVIPNPARIICAGLNYVAHRSEGNHATAAEAPPLFLRLAESQVGHGEPLLCPRESTQFDYEAELALIIGRRGRRIAEADALDYVAGFSCYNDCSVRDWQLATPQWTPGKNFPATGAFGPWMVTTDELDPTRSLSLVCRLNGIEMQRTTTDLMMFSIPKLIAYISSFTTLEPGDVIVTGTPGGVGLRRTPQVWMKPGDIVEVEVEGVGILRNPVAAEVAT